MPVAISCDCGKQLRVSEDHLGKKIRCPACGEALLVEEQKASKAPAKKPVPAPAAGTPDMISFACACGKKMQAKAEYAGRGVKCPECGEPVKVPKSGGAAPVKKQSDEDDDIPVSKRLDGLLSKSAARKKAAADDDDYDDDDTPARGRGRDDDEDDDPGEDDDRPKKGKKDKKKGKKGGSVMPLVLIGSALLLLLTVGGLGAWYFLGGGSSGDMALVPGNAGGFVTVRVADLMATQAGKDALAQLPPDAQTEMREAETKMGLSPKDLTRVTMVLLSVDEIAGAAMGGRGGPPEMYMIVSTSKSIDQGKILDGFEMKGTAAKDHNGKKMYEKGTNALYFHSDQILVAGPPAGVRKAIDQAVKPRTDGSLAKLTSQVGSQHIVLGFGVPAALAQLKQTLPPQAAPFAPLVEVQHLMVVGNVTGTSLAVDVTGMFPDNGKAADAKTALDGVKVLAGAVPNMPPQASEALKNLTLSQSGTDVVISMKSSLDMDALKGLAGNLGGFGGGRPGPRPVGPGPGPVVPGGGGGVMGVRDAADRSRDSNNLKQIGLAFHNLHDTQGNMKWAIYSPQQQPLLSWRVALLPYLGQDALYKQLKLNEPWDSTHNKRFHNQMPAVYRTPGRTAPPGMTFYQCFEGQGAVFNAKDPAGRTITRISDGTSNTILVTEAAQAVNWMQPKDISYQPGPNGFTISGRLGGRFPTGFNAVFADGAVKFLPSTRDPKEMNALITAEGGEPVAP